MDLSVENVREESAAAWIMSRDLKRACSTLGRREARYLVSMYYRMQRDRIRDAHQVRAAEEHAEPHAALEWLQDRHETLEAQIKRALGYYAEGHEVGRWMLSIVGIGPVIAAGMLAHIDITKAPTVGHIWRFAGLDPTLKWEKGQKRPWNAELKTLCWKLGESFVKSSGHESSFYGPIYAARKKLETERNEAGAFAEQAAAALAAKRYRADTVARKAYEEGKLPAARIHLRATRYAVKLFLSHLHHVWYEVEFRMPPPKPFVISHMGHVDYIPPPNWPMA